MYPPIKVRGDAPPHGGRILAYPLDGDYCPSGTNGSSRLPASSSTCIGWQHAHCTPGPSVRSIGESALEQCKPRSIVASRSQPRLVTTNNLARSNSLHLLSWGPVSPMASVGRRSLTPFNTRSGIKTSAEPVCSVEPVERTNLAHSVERANLAPSVGWPNPARSVERANAAPSVARQDRAPSVERADRAPSKEPVDRATPATSEPANKRWSQEEAGQLQRMQLSVFSQVERTRLEIEARIQKIDETSRRVTAVPADEENVSVTSHSDTRKSLMEAELEDSWREMETLREENRRLRNEKEKSRIEQEVLQLHTNELTDQIGRQSVHINRLTSQLGGQNWRTSSTASSRASICSDFLLHNELETSSASDHVSGTWTPCEVECGWNPRTMGANLALSQDCMTLWRRDGACRNCVAIAGKPLEQDSFGYHFSVRITQTADAWVGGLGMGVTSLATMGALPDTAWRVPNATVMGYWGRFFTQGKECFAKWNAEKAQVGDEVSLLVTTDGDVLLFHNNTLMQRIAAHIYTATPLYAMVDVFAATSEITLLPDHELPPPASWSHVSAETVDSMLQVERS